MSAAKKSVIELATRQVHAPRCICTALLDGSKPIRGGIPLCSSLRRRRGIPNHGFARVNNWKLSQLDQTVKLFANALATAIHIQNKSEGDMAFQALLHTYLSVDDVRDGGVVVEGLKGLTYHDKVAGQEKTEERDVLTFDQETDSVYANAHGKEQVVTIEKEAFIKSGPTHTAQLSDVVVWNPWIDKAKGMSDFGDDEYPTMVCVEPGRVSEQQKLPAGQTFALLQVIKLSAL
ncbi:Glycoside hydrolase-type carbohydrate-binding, subgroup [Phytophthora cactorum]|nr:Glycoside hydrolase-type carbohydrate-binding, subgroup [Phytophthora cactorum]